MTYFLESLSWFSRQVYHEIIHLFLQIVVTQQRSQEECHVRRHERLFYFFLIIWQQNLMLYHWPNINISQLSVAFQQKDDHYLDLFNFSTHLHSIAIDMKLKFYGSNKTENCKSLNTLSFLYISLVFQVLQFPLI